MIIAHLSDFHVGEFKFKEKLLKKALNQVKNIHPDVVIVSGDITNNGYYQEFIEAKKYLDEISEIIPTITVPGNHDARHVGYEVFEEVIGPRSGVLKNKNKKFVVIGLDSSEPDLDCGKIGREQQKWLEKELKKAKNKFKIVALHHHIIPVPKTGRERNVLLDAGDILESLVKYDVDLVVCGHRHVPYSWNLEGCVFATAGTVSSPSLRAKNPNSYNVYLVNEKEIKVKLCEVEGKMKILGKYKRKNG